MEAVIIFVFFPIVTTVDCFFTCTVRYKLLKRILNKISLNMAVFLNSFSGLQFIIVIVYSQSLPLSQVYIYMYQYILIIYDKLINNNDIR